VCFSGDQPNAGTADKIRNSRRYVRWAVFSEVLELPLQFDFQLVVNLRQDASPYVLHRVMSFLRERLDRKHPHTRFYIGHMMHQNFQDSILTTEALSDKFDVMLAKAIFVLATAILHFSLFQVNLITSQNSRIRWTMLAPRPLVFIRAASSRPSIRPISSR